MGLQIQVFNANTSREIGAAFESMERERPDALFVAPDPFFAARRVQLAHLATRYAVPAIYVGREFAEAGGLMSYGANIADAWRQATSIVSSRARRSDTRWQRSGPRRSRFRQDLGGMHPRRAPPVRETED